MADDRTIQVQLSLLSGSDSQAAKDLANSMKEMEQFFRTFRASDFVDAADKLSKVHAEMMASTQQLNRMVEEARATQTRGQGEGGRSTPPDATRLGVLLPDGPSEQTARSQTANESRRTAEAAEAAKQKEAAFMRNEALVREMREATGAQLPEKAFREYVQREHAEGREVDVSRFSLPTPSTTIPQYGNLTFQDYLNMGRSRSVNRSLQEGADVEKELGSAATFGRLAGWAGTGYAMLDAGRKLRDKIGIHPLEFASQGDPMGLSREGGNLGLPLPFQSPLSPAGQEGMRQQLDTLRLRSWAGINAEQAQQITAASTEAGFSGDLGHSVRMDFFGKGMQKYGFNAQNLIPMTQVLRTGSGTVRDLTDTLDAMATSARAANMNLSQTTQAINAAGEAAQQTGGSYLQGVQFGTQFQQGTGLPATVGNTLMGNPMAQAYIAAQTGTPAMVQGALPANVRMQATRQGLADLTRAFTGSFGNKTFENRDPVTGQVTHQYTSDRHQAIAAAGQQFGLNYDETVAMMRTGGRQATMEQFNLAASNYTGAALRRSRTAGVSQQAISQYMTKHMTSPGYDERQTDFSNYHIDGAGNLYENVVGHGKGERHNVLVQKAAEFNATRESIVAPGLRRGTNKDSTYQLNELDKLAKAMGVSSKDIQDANKKKTPKEQADTLRNLVVDKQRENNAAYQIAFTGEAEKFFKALTSGKSIKNFDWNTPNEPSSLPGGPNPLSDIIPPQGGMTNGTASQFGP